jgi:hypothetical protein
MSAGAGIVADSDPAFEQQECINKAKALFGVTEEAKRFAASLGAGNSYLMRDIFWPPQMPMAQPSTLIVLGASSRRWPV